MNKDQYLVGCKDYSNGKFKLLEECYQPFIGLYDVLKPFSLQVEASWE